MLNCHYEPIETNWGFSIQWTHWSSGTTSLQTLRLQRRQRGVAWRRLTPLVLRWRHLFTDLLLLDATEEMRKPKIQHILPLLVWVSASFFWFGWVHLFLVWVCATFCFLSNVYFKASPYLWVRNKFSLLPISESKGICSDSHSQAMLGLCPKLNFTLTKNL